MLQSESIKELATALNIAQGEMSAPKELSKALNYKYADLATVIAVMKEPFKNNGLSLAQSPDIIGDKWVMVTRIMHKSGEWLQCITPLLFSEVLGGKGSNNPMQLMGSAITYARRYALGAICNLAPEVDDDCAPKEVEPAPRRVNHELEEILSKLSIASTTEYEALTERCKAIRASLTHPEFEALKEAVGAAKSRLVIEN